MNSYTKITLSYLAFGFLWVLVTDITTLELAPTVVDSEKAQFKHKLSDRRCVEMIEANNTKIEKTPPTT